jgi:hypothetical protein
MIEILLVLAYDYIIYNNGIAAESRYPYEAAGVCWNFFIYKKIIIFFQIL